MATEKESMSEMRTPRVHRNALIEVTLPGGDIVALSFTGNLLELEGDERSLVFDARDLIANYRKTHKAEDDLGNLPSFGSAAHVEAKAASKNGKMTAPAEVTA